MRDSDGRIEFPQKNDGDGIQFMRDAGLLDEEDRLIVSKYMELPPIGEENEDGFGKVIGVDTRIQILNASLGTAPYDGIVRLTISSRGRIFRGTGFLVKDDAIVTAGHCFCWKEDDAIVTADAIGVTQILPAVLNRTAGVISYRIDPRRPREPKDENDWAILRISRPLGAGGHIMPVINGSHLSRGSSYTCEIAGYPARAQGRVTTDLWSAQGPLQIPRIFSSTILTYEISTSGGQSGAPVFMDYNGVKAALGIHVGYMHSCGRGVNYCRKIDDELYREILTY